MKLICRRPWGRGNGGSRQGKELEIQISGPQKLQELTSDVASTPALPPLCLALTPPWAPLPILLCLHPDHS